MGYGGCSGTCSGGCSGGCEWSTGESVCACVIDHDRAVVRACITDDLACIARTRAVKRWRIWRRAGVEGCAALEHLRAISRASAVPAGVGRAVLVVDLIAIIPEKLRGRSAAFPRVDCDGGGCSGACSGGCSGESRGGSRRGG